MAAWEFHDIPAKECENISLLLNHSEAVLREVVGLCNTRALDVNITFTYQILAFTVKIDKINLINWMSLIDDLYYFKNIIFLGRSNTILFVL